MQRNHRPKCRGHGPAEADVREAATLSQDEAEEGAEIGVESDEGCEAEGWGRGPGVVVGRGDGCAG